MRAAELSAEFVGALEVAAAACVRDDVARPVDVRDEHGELHALVLGARASANRARRSAVGKRRGSGRRGAARCVRHVRQRAFEERASCWQRRRELRDGSRDDELQREWRRRAESGELAPLPEAEGDAPPPHIWPIYMALGRRRGELHWVCECARVVDESAEDLDDGGDGVGHVDRSRVVLCHFLTRRVSAPAEMDEGGHERADAGVRLDDGNR